jgi:hypothetical protein
VAAKCFKENDQHDDAILYEGCGEHLTHDKSKNNDGSLMWQCFVHQKFTDLPEPLKLWTMLPRKFRKWWLICAREVLNIVNVSLEHPEAATRDGAVMIEELKNVTKNLENTSWANVQVTREKHQALPLVRCPWGCSECCGSINTVALDVFIDWHLGGPTQSHSSDSEQWCSAGFRKNVTSDPVHLLNNPDAAWQCLITFRLMDSKEMRVCTCRHHSSEDILECVHAPTNPTGAIIFKGDNDLAQVVATPRTIRPFQAKRYSHSYQLNRAMGTYAGVDTVDLCADLNFGEHERSNLSFVCHVIAANQRTDYRSFTLNLPKKDHQFCLRDARSFVKESDELCEDQEEALRRQKTGATHMPLEDVFDTQMQMKKESSGAILHINNENGDSRSTNFVPKWPRRIVPVMPYSSENGSVFKNCKGFQKKEVIFWFVLNISHIVPELWRSMDSMVKTNQDWQGWGLTHIVAHVFPNKAMQTNKNNPFSSNRSNFQKNL